MKNLYLCVLSLILVSCSLNQNNETGKQNIKINNVQSQVENITLASLGESCSGAERVRCTQNLECKIQNSGEPNAHGICVEKVINPQECPKTKTPVCGQRNGKKNGYLNACEAERHGAEILYDGLCKPDKGATGDCSAKIVGIGNCEAYITGVFFNPITGKCESGGVSGCSADTPFQSINLCQQFCEGKAPIKVCPDERIINKMPSIDAASALPNEYFILNGKRRELREFDLSWVEEFCEVKTQEVF